MSTKKAKPTSASSRTQSSSRREQLQARREAEIQRQKRTGLITALVAGVLALAVIAVVTVVVIQNQRTKREAAANEAASQITPPNAVGKDAILANPDTAATAQYTLNIYMDYQCPICKQSEDRYAGVWKSLADEGFIKLQLHTMTFMDQNLRNDSSTRVAIGAACSDLTGTYLEFHTAAFKNQPAQEGDDYTEQVVTQTIPQQAGITGADYDTWKKCYDSKATAEFVRMTNENAFKAGVTGTPTIYVNGNKNPQVQTQGGTADWWKVIDPTPEAWKKAITEAAAS